MNFKEIFETYKGLEKEIYILFIGRIVNSLGAFVHPLMALILTSENRNVSCRSRYVCNYVICISGTMHDIRG